MAGSRCQVVEFFPGEAEWFLAKEDSPAILQTGQIREANLAKIKATIFHFIGE